MNQEDIKKKLDEAKDSAQNALSGIKVHLKDMDKEKAKEALSGAKEKAKVALAEITANFKADEGAEGVKKYQSMFKNLWKSGTTGKATLVAASFVVLLLFKSIFFGGSSDGGFDSSKSVDVDTLVIKGLYMRQAGDEAMKACKKIASSSRDLVAIDFRKGIEREKDAVMKAKDKELWDERVKEAGEDVDSFLAWLDKDSNTFVMTNAEFKGCCPENWSLPIGKNAAIGFSPAATMRRHSRDLFANLYGYAHETMIPVAKTLKPIVAGSFDYPSNYYSSMSFYEYWRKVVLKCSDRDFQEQVAQICAKKGMKYVRPKRSFDDPVAWFRLVLKTKDGKSVTKKQLVDGVIEKYKKERKGVEKCVDYFLNWVEFDTFNHGATLHKFAPLENRGVEINDAWVMGYLANRFNLVVEWSVLACPEIVEFNISHISGSVDEALKKEKLFKLGGSWSRMLLKTTNGVEVAKEEVVKNWLAARGCRPPSDKVIIPKKNLIEIAIEEDGKREDELKGVCFVWIDGEDKVKEVYFNEKGMARIFNAGDLSSDEFAEALVKNYQGDIPSLTTDVRTEAATDDLLASMKTRTWIYKDPRGYQVKLLERDFYDVVGQKVNLRADLALALALKADKTRDKYFSFSAIKPESARKFD